VARETPRTGEMTMKKENIRELVTCLIIAFVIVSALCIGLFILVDIAQ
jgi:hypothetical protein